MKRRGLFETGAGGSPPNTYNSFYPKDIKVGLFGEFFGPWGFFCEFFLVKKNTIQPRPLALPIALDKATEHFLENDKSSSEEKLENWNNRGSHFYLALLGRMAFESQQGTRTGRTKRFYPIADKSFPRERMKFLKQLSDAQGGSSQYWRLFLPDGPI